MWKPMISQMAICIQLSFLVSSCVSADQDISVFRFPHTECPRAYIMNPSMFRPAYSVLNVCCRPNTSPFVRDQPLSNLGALSQDAIRPVQTGALALAMRSIPGRSKSAKSHTSSASKVLVLNASYEPLSVVSARR